MINLKRIIAVILMSALSLGLFSGCGSEALVNSYDSDVPDTGRMTLSGDSVVSGDGTKAFSSGLAVAPADFKSDVEVSSDAGELLLIDNTKNQVLYQKNAYKEIAPASTTKLMTAYLTLENCSLDEKVTLDSDIYLDPDAVQIFIGAGDTITVGELLHGLLIYSANDCAEALARYVGGSEAGFVRMMNEAAVRLGAVHSHFMNPHGLDKQGHYSCAYDLYLIFRENLKNKDFRDIINTENYDLHYTDENGEDVTVNLDSTNLYFQKEYPVPEGVTVAGGKTGTTGNAGNCLVLDATGSSGDDLIGVVLHADDHNDLYSTMSQLLTYNMK